MLRWWIRGVVATILIIMAVGVLQTRSGLSGYDDQVAVAAALAQGANARQLLTEYVFLEGRWPERVEQVDFLDQVLRDIEADVATPFELILTPKSGDYRGGLRGAKLILSFDQNSGRWECRAGDPPIPAKLLPDQCGGQPPNPGVSLISYWLTVMLLLVGIGVVIYGLNHPQVLPLLRDPERLRHLPIDQVQRTGRILKLLFRLPAAKRAARISSAQWQLLERFAAAPTSLQASQLGARLGARSAAVVPSPTPWPLFNWAVPEDFPLPLLRCQAMVLRTPSHAHAAPDRLRRDYAAKELVILIVPSQAVLEELDDSALEQLTNVVLLDPQNVTALLLAAKPADWFIAHAARPIRQSRLTPYQTRGGVTRAANFFGRERELAQLLGHPDSNCLLLGGRQLGKTSLLKAVQRHHARRQQAGCHYVVLRDHQLTPALARHAGLAADATLDACIARLRRQAGGTTLTLLIDEADGFARWEQDHHYPTLNVIRAISEEQSVRFVFAGFWDLYHSAVLDYQSPLRNFGEQLTVGALEPHACRELAVKPLKMFGIDYQHTSMVDDLVAVTGGRANLVALVAQGCMEQLDIRSRTITPELLEAALRSDPVAQALAGWGRLSADPIASRLDRIIIYAAVESGSVGLADVANLLSQTGIPVEPETIKASFQRLQLAFVLQQWDAGYRFCVPLFRQQIAAEDTATLLRQELVAWRDTA